MVIIPETIIPGILRRRSIYKDQCQLSRIQELRKRRVHFNLKPKVFVYEVQENLDPQEEEAQNKSSDSSNEGEEEGKSALTLIIDPYRWWQLEDSRWTVTLSLQ